MIKLEIPTEKKLNDSASFFAYRPSSSFARRKCNNWRDKKEKIYTLQNARLQIYVRVNISNKRKNVSRGTVSFCGSTTKTSQQSYLKISNSAQSALQIIPNILQRFDATRKTNETILDANLSTFFWTLVPVTDYCRLLNKGFYPS